MMIMTLWPPLLQESSQSCTRCSQGSRGRSQAPSTAAAGCTCHAAFELNPDKTHRLCRHQSALEEQRRLEQLALEKRNAEAQAEATAAAAAAQRAVAAAAAAERSAAKEAEKEIALSTEQTAVSKKGGFDQKQVEAFLMLVWLFLTLHQVYINWFLTLQQVKQGISAPPL